MGHDHDVIAASPAVFEDQFGPGPRPRAPLWRTLVLGALVGTAFGAAEMAWRMHADLTPSVARRAPGLLLNAALVYAPTGALLGLVGAALSRLLDARFVPGFRRLLTALACLVLALATFAAALASRAVEPRPSGDAPAPVASDPARPNLVLIVVDTLRADALGAYGGPATPGFDRLAERGLVFDEVIAPSSWTLPSMASLFAGSYPATHGYTDFDGSLGLDRAPAHLAEVLAAEGYACRAVVGNTLLDSERGFARGFELYDAYDFSLERDLWLNRLVNAALRRTGHVRTKMRALIPVVSSRFPFVDTRLSFYNLDGDLTERVFAFALPPPADRPLFLYVHYIAPHTPYLTHPVSTTLAAPVPDRTPPERLRELYAGEVAYTDAQLGRLLERLEGAGVLENALVCVTADHGEAFGEHGHHEHGYDLHREAVRVPWILSGPPLEARLSEAGQRPPLRFGAPVSLVDLAPTVLELLGLPDPGFEGRALLPAVLGEGRGLGPVFAETSSRHLTPGAHHLAAFEGTRRLLRILAGSEDGSRTGTEALFDTASDPGELKPLASSRGFEALAEALDAYAARAGPAAAPQAPPDLEAMQALGYVDGLDDEPAEADSPR